jgi:hypothetical protein
MNLIIALYVLAYGGGNGLLCCKAVGNGIGVEWLKRYIGVYNRLTMRTNGFYEALFIANYYTVQFQSRI